MLDPQSPPAKRLLFALFLFLYVPALWFHGWKLLFAHDVDFPTYYFAAQLTFQQGHLPYGASAFNAISAAWNWHLNSFIYPPPALLFLWPLAWFPFSVAKILFVVASHLGWITSIGLLLTRLIPRPDDFRVAFALLAVGLVYLLNFDPASITLEVGQINLIVLPFLCLALVAIRSDDAPAWQIALPLSLAIVLKTYPVLLLAPLFFRGRFKAIFLTCTLFALYAALAHFLLPAGAWRIWLTDIAPSGGYANNFVFQAGPWNQNLNAFVSRLFLINDFSDAPLGRWPIGRPVGTALAGLVAASTAWFSFRRSRRLRDEASGDDEMATYLLMIFLIAPLSWEHHLVYILPAALLAIHHLVTSQVRGAWAILLPAALALIAWRVPFNEPALTHGWWTLLISIKFYATMILWLYFLRRLARAGRSQAVAPAASESASPFAAHPINRSLSLD